MPTLAMTIMHLLMVAMQELPTLIEDGKRLFHAAAGSGDEGLQKVVNVAAAFEELAGHAREAAVVATGNPEKLPAAQPLPATAATDSTQVGADPKQPAPGSIVSQPFPSSEAAAQEITQDKDAEIADLKAQLAALKPPVDTGPTL